ncbi:hypothetical protein EMPS_09443 [Entomortierella parvispora]|uniref:IPT/TIG domain-containing protein n=1 Tax=Entomortierella parvispora TaxID=205924 RepID=A0A9P3HHZ8_9FUNG|nr:hypothetical protein EMPS_09443 [Entomortierella parvispora]
MTPREGFQIEITGIPAENAKCRVETQLKIGLCIKDAQGEIARQWKQFRLPRDLIAKEKHRLTKYNGRDKNLADSEILTLESRLVCHQDTAKVLECCENCIGRERKRAHRRKETQKLPGALGSTPISGMHQQQQLQLQQQQQQLQRQQQQQQLRDTNKGGPTGDDCGEDMIPPSPTDPAAYEAWERSRIIVFSSTQYVNVSSGECILPTRITCYCRHHGEKIGFRILFTARDWTGAIVTSALTNPVMMMDDHKSGKKPPTRPTSVVPEMNTTQRSGSTPALSCPVTPTMDNTYYFERTLEPKLEVMEEDDLDLEAGRPEPYIDDDNDEGWASKETDMLPSLEQATFRAASKRRVDDDQRKEDIQMQQTFKRKTSHGILPTPAGFDVPIKSEPQTPVWPFMPGSPFANDDKHNVFAPSFSQAMMGLPAQANAWNDTFPSRIKDENEHLSAESRSMMEDFTTLDGSASSPPPRPAPIRTRASFTIPMMDYTNNDMLMQLPSSASSSSTFQDSFQASPGSEQHHFINLEDSQQHELNRPNYHAMTSVSQPPMSSVAWVPFSATMPAPNMDAFQYRMPSNITHHPSSSAFMQIPVTAADTLDIDEQNQYRRSSSVSSASGMQWKKEERSGSIDGTRTPVPKKRGRPRKAQVGVSTTVMGSTSSAASSPMVSPKAPSMNMPPSPSPPPYSIPQASQSATASTASTARALSNASATVAAAQFLLLHQQQQQLKQTNLSRQNQPLFSPLPLMQADPMESAAVAGLGRATSVVPRVQKVIPARGPIQGGIEVTLLGKGFFPGMVPVFDGVPALNVQFYGAETVICQLPARAVAGPVLVQAMMGEDAVSREPLEKDETGLALSAFGVATAMASKGGVFFEYEEDKGDRDLMGLALQVLGMKMNGRVESPHQIAMRIMGTAAAAEAAQQQQQQQQQQQLLQQQSHQQHQQLLQTKLIQHFPSAAMSAASLSLSSSITIPATVGSPCPTESVMVMNAPPATAVVSSKPTVVTSTTTGTSKAPLTRTLTSASFASNFTPIQLQSPQSQLLFQDRTRPLPQR